MDIRETETAVTQLFRVLATLAVFFLPALLGTTVTEALTQSEIADDVDAFLSETTASQGIPVAHVVLFENGQTVFENTYGTYAKGRDARRDTLFALGSISKSFAALAILQLEAEGKLRLDQPISDFAIFSEAGISPTIRDLLTHRSGLSTYYGNLNIADKSTGPDALRDVAVEVLRDAQSDGPEFAYSNANYQILGALIEQLDQQPYEEAIKTRILSPLGMTDSFVRSHDDSTTTVAEGYRYAGPIVFGGVPEPGRVVTPQSGVYSSAREMTTYLLALSMGQDTVVPGGLASNLSDIAGSGAYGAGWFLSDRMPGERRWLYHGGMNAGYKAEAGFEIGTGNGFLILTNASDGFTHGDVMGVTEGVRDIVFGKSPKIPGKPSSNMAVLAGLFALFLLLIIMTARSALEMRRPHLKESRTRIIVASGFALGCLVLCGFVMPRAVNVPLSGILLFQPDVGVLSVSIIVVSVVLLVLTIMQLKPRSFG